MCVAGRTLITLCCLAYLCKRVFTPASRAQVAIRQDLVRESADLLEKFRRVSLRSFQDLQCARAKPHSAARSLAPGAAGRRGAERGAVPHNKLRRGKQWTEGDEILEFHPFDASFCPGRLSPTFPLPL